jgi:hypothetical protein
LGRRSRRTRSTAEVRWSGQAPLRLLVGPYVHACHCEYMAGAFDDYDTLTFGSWSGADLQVEDFASMDEIVRRLPHGWQPDLMLLWRPEYTYLPGGIESAGFPVAMLISDWYVTFAACFEAARFVNVVVTGTRGERVYRAAGFDHVVAMPMLGYQEGFDGALRQPVRDIDVFCAGNPNWSVHRERERVNAELMRLPSSVNFVHAPFVSRAEYTRLLGRSKIFVNQTVIGEINMKVYEVTAAETCLFLEKDNLDVHDYLVPGESVVLFDRDDLVTKILYYLEHEDQRSAIARAGHRAMQARSYRANMVDIVERLRAQGRDALLARGREICRAPREAIAVHHAGYTMHRLSLAPSKVVRILRELPDVPGARRAFLLRFSRLSACAREGALPTDGPESSHAPAIGEMIAELHELWKNCTDDLCLDVAWAQLAPHHVAPQEAAPAFDRLIGKLEAGARIPIGGTAIYPMPERRSYVFERLAWEQIERGVPADDVLRRYLLELAYTAKSTFLRRCGERRAATQALRRAIEWYPEGEDTRPMLARDLRDLGDFHDATVVLEEHLARRPLDLPAYVQLVELHLRNERPDRAMSVIDDLERIVTVFGDREWIERIPRLRMGVPAPVAEGAGA